MVKKIFNEINEFSRKIAREAGTILIEGFRSGDAEISYKSRTDMVTSVDRESEEYLYGEIRMAWPDHGIVAEEGNSIEGEGDFLWYVDPLDGTNNFAHGIPVFSVSIGVWSVPMERMVSGVVYVPCLDEMFHALRGSGSFCNGKQIDVSKTDDIRYSLIATGFPYGKDELERNNLRQFNAVLPTAQGVRRMGSAAIDLAYVAMGRLEGYWELHMHSWDIAAGMLLVEEAGGKVTDYHGGPCLPDEPDVVATNGHIHSQLLDLLKNC